MHDVQKEKKNILKNVLIKKCIHLDYYQTRSRVRQILNYFDLLKVAFKFEQEPKPNPPVSSKC